MQISYSDIAAFNRCRFLYQQTRLNNWPQSDSTPKQLGNFVHIGLAAHLRGESFSRAIDLAWEGANAGSDLTPEELSAAAKTAYPIVQRTIDYLGDRWRTRYILKGDDTVPMVEYPITTYLGGFGLEKIEVKGVVDWVAVDNESGQTWLFDFKTRTNLEPDGTDDFNLQMAMYQYMLQVETGVPVVGSVLFQIRTLIPQIPKLNKDGSMSRADIVTDWATYKAALETHGLNPLEYLETQFKLEAKRFFHMTRTFRNRVTLDHVWNDVVRINAAEMLHTTHNTTGDPTYIAPRSLSNMCKICSINERCLNQLHGVSEEFDIIFEE